MISMVALLLTLLSCSSSEDVLSSSGLLTRASLDIRGVRPSVQELDAVTNNRWSFEQSVDQYLKDSNFPRVTAERWAPIFDTRRDETLFPADMFGLENEFRFAYAVGDEPLRVYEEVIRRNLPWSTVLQADWTVLNNDLMSVYPAMWVGVPPELDSEWSVARYLDGRPAGGVLVSNGMWWRYETSLNNASRQRANQVTRIFLCRDYLEIPVSFDSDIDLTSEAAVNSAIKEDPGCVACHATLDPLAAFMGGVFARRKSDPTEMVYYHPERENLSSTQLGVAPMWNGESGDTLGDLGELLVGDPNFSTCATSQVLESLLGDSSSTDAQELSTKWEQDWNMSMARLVREIVLSDAYKQRWLNSDTEWNTVTLYQLESQVAHLTGYTLSIDSYPFLRADHRGVANMVANDGFSIPLVLIQQELAHLSARYWMLQSNQPPFDIGTVDQPKERLITLSRMILGVEPTTEELTDWNQYIDLLRGELSPKEMWASIATVMMQDPRFLVY